MGSKDSERPWQEWAAVEKVKEKGGSETVKVEEKETGVEKACMGSRETKDTTHTHNRVRAEARGRCATYRKR